ncbi:hypothetical protein Taro_006469 [Colocasia esculenta]|uniref:Phytocyanin domain-containing protein n=1 Tax=Colocasia esculenta TaxID=4460 RepID=A0A843TVF1_COLES|nr:hypothetical protein [Colocasia esculenta]
MAVSVALLVAALLACTCLLQSPAVVSADRYTVGSEKGWNPGVNYTVWAKDKHFYVGDWLVFYYQSGQADVLQVNEAAYNQCLADSPITNYSKGRSFAFELNKTGRYYFICSRGYCYGGMKLAIKVEKLRPAPPAGSAAVTSLAAAVPDLAAAVVRTLGVAAAVAAALLRSI